MIPHGLLFSAPVQPGEELYVSETSYPGVYPNSVFIDNVDQPSGTSSLPSKSFSRYTEESNFGYPKDMGAESLPMDDFGTSNSDAYRAKFYSETQSPFYGSHTSQNDFSFDQASLSTLSPATLPDTLSPTIDWFRAFGNQSSHISDLQMDGQTRLFLPEPPSSAPAMMELGRAEFCHSWAEGHIPMPEWNARSPVFSDLSSPLSNYSPLSTDGSASSSSPPSTSPSSPSPSSSELASPSHIASDLPLSPGRKRRVEGSKVCAHCNATSTPLWRREPKTMRPLCNACGLYLQQRHTRRPQELIDADAFNEDVLDQDPNFDGPECSHCHTRQTSVWRRSRDGKQLCNACGVYARLRGKDRPLSLKRNRIKPRCAKQIK